MVLPLVAAAGAGLAKLGALAAAHPIMASIAGSVAGSAIGAGIEKAMSGGQVDVAALQQRKQEMLNDLAQKGVTGPEAEEMVNAFIKQKAAELQSQSSGIGGMVGMAAGAAVPMLLGRKAKMPIKTVNAVPDPVMPAPKGIEYSGRPAPRTPNYGQAPTQAEPMPQFQGRPAQEPPGAFMTRENVAMPVDEMSPMTRQFTMPPSEPLGLPFNRAGRRAGPEERAALMQLLRRMSLEGD